MEGKSQKAFDDFRLPGGQHIKALAMRLRLVLLSAGRSTKREGGTESSRPLDLSASPDFRNRCNPSHPRELPAPASLPWSLSLRESARSRFPSHYHCPKKESFSPERVRADPGYALCPQDMKRNVFSIGYEYACQNGTCHFGMRGPMHATRRG